MRKSMRKGFTLVELLIVIVVIGVLSAMMMLSSTEAVSSAKAADIISDLRNLKTAALSWYVDNLDTASASSFKIATATDHNKAAIIKYLGETDKDSTKMTNYDFANGKTIDTEWYVSCAVSDSKVQEKLKNRASSVGLCKDAISKDVYTGEATVYMFIR